MIDVNKFKGTQSVTLENEGKSPKFSIYVRNASIVIEVDDKEDYDLETLKTCLVIIHEEIENIG